MAGRRTVIGILNLTDGSNCRACGFATCTAFAAAVHQGTTRLRACTKIDPAVLAEEGGGEEALPEVSEPGILEMQERISGLDLEAAARRLGAPFADGRVTVHVLGKRVEVDSKGMLHTDIHVNPWILYPVLGYVAGGGGVEPAGEWVTFHDLPGGRERQPLFARRCLAPCKKVADTNPGFFDDLVRLFSGRQVEDHYESDISLVLHPLPRLPVLIAYWKPEEELPSDLNIFFDRTAVENLDIELIYLMTTGLVFMFEKIARSHRHDL
jgi:hypothetical protein